MLAIIIYTNDGLILRETICLHIYAKFKVLLETCDNSNIYQDQILIIATKMITLTGVFIMSQFDLFPGHNQFVFSLYGRYKPRTKRLGISP